MDSFRKELSELINRNSMENASNTPDFILAEYLVNCLMAFNGILDNEQSGTKDLPTKSSSPENQARRVSRSR